MFPLIRLPEKSKEACQTPQEANKVCKFPLIRLPEKSKESASRSLTLNRFYTLISGGVKQWLKSLCFCRPPRKANPEHPLKNNPFQRIKLHSRIPTNWDRCLTLVVAMITSFPSFAIKNLPWAAVVAWHTLIGGLDSVRSEGTLVPLQLGVRELKFLLQTKSYFSCATAVVAWHTLISRLAL